MGPTIVDVKLKAEGEVTVRALVDTGFYGDIIVGPDIADRNGLDPINERTRVLPNGERVKVRFGISFFEVMGFTAGGEVEVGEGLKLPPEADALIGVTALEKLGLKLDSRTGKVEKVELYLL